MMDGFKGKSDLVAFCWEVSDTVATPRKDCPILEKGLRTFIFINYDFLFLAYHNNLNISVLLQYDSMAENDNWTINLNS